METFELEKLEGVGSATAGKLRAAGMTTVEAVAVTPPKEIAEKTAKARVTLLYGAKDTKYNNAQALKEYIETL